MPGDVSKIIFPLKKIKTKMEPRVIKFIANYFYYFPCTCISKLSTDLKSNGLKITVDTEHW